MVNLDARTLSAWNVIENRQAAITIDEIIAVGSILGSDERWREAMGKRGFTSLANVFCFPFSAGPSLDPALAGRRVLKSSCVDRTGAGNNIWGKPIENLMATVDLTERKVVSITDLGVLPAPPDTPSHAWKDSGQVRPVTKPVEIASPQGSNITITGGEVRWDNWSFHVRLDPRLGAVLSLIRYDDHGLAREIVYQLSASEMFVPYMDPASTWSFRGYMDIGEYGFGVLATQLRPGLDCPAGASFLDVTIADTKGAPLGLKGVVCIFERPTGDPLWRHEEAVNQTYEARANTELVVRMAPVVGNYDYLVDYVFDRAGDIDVRLGAYGIDETKGVASSTLSDPTAATDTAYGTLVGNRLVAVNHDHYMAFRIDMDVDGPANRFVEDRIVPRRISENGPRRSLWQVESRAMAVEGPVTTPINAAQFRVESTTKKNALGYPTSYQLMPGHTDSSILSPDDPLQIRAGFSAYTMWSSAYAPHEFYAAGAYPNENPEVDGLPKWVSAKRSDRRQRPRALVHDRLSARAARRGLAGDARPLARLPLEAVQFLRPKPGARCAAGAGGCQMKPTAIISIIASLIAPATPALAGPDGARTAPKATLLYLDQQGWEQASGEAKAELAADFMRVFCGNPAMQAANLVGCLDHGEGGGSMFERALTCVAAAPVSQSR